MTLWQRAVASCCKSVHNMWFFLLFRQADRRDHGFQVSSKAIECCIIHHHPTLFIMQKTLSPDALSAIHQSYYGYVRCAYVINAHTRKKQSKRKTHLYSNESYLCDTPHRWEGRPRTNSETWEIITLGFGRITSLAQILNLLLQHC